MGPITIRPAELGGADMHFIDQLQKKHSQMVGFLPFNQIEKRIKGEDGGHVLIAETNVQTSSPPRPNVQSGDSTSSGSVDVSTFGRLDVSAKRERIGYIIFADRYFKRDDLGIVFQLNIVPHMQRGLVGAALVKAAFEACPWGVKLFCCWCAQDLAANHFWESVGFVPIAFRAGARGKANGGNRADDRIQIFWQRRIREGDDQTPYWYPSQTSGGAMRENRLALPIPCCRTSCLAWRKAFQAASFFSFFK
jgi:hypothetical protein